MLHAGTSLTIYIHALNSRETALLTTSVCSSPTNNLQASSNQMHLFNRGNSCYQSHMTKSNCPNGPTLFHSCIHYSRFFCFKFTFNHFIKMSCPYVPILIKIITIHFILYFPI